MDPITISALIAGGSTIIGGLLNSNSSNNALDAQLRATVEANALQREGLNQNRYFYDVGRADLQPWVGSGGSANAVLSGYLGLDTPAGYATDQNYAQYVMGNPDLAREWSRLQQDGTARARGWNNISDYGRWHWQNHGINEPGRSITPTQQTQSSTPTDTAGVERGSLLQPYTSENFYSDPMYAGADRTPLAPYSIDDFYASPDYLFRQSEGESAINRAFASRGGYDSGPAMKALIRYNSDLASGEWGNAWNRDYADRTLAMGEYGNAYNRDAGDKDRIYNYLMGVSGSGLNAAAGTGSLGAGTAGLNSQVYSNMGNIAMSAGNAIGANTINQGNIRTSVLGDLASLGEEYFRRRNNTGNTPPLYLSS